MTPVEPLAAPRTLLSGPAGSGKTTRALELIRGAAVREGQHGGATDLSAATLLVLPTYAQVMHVKRVALSRWKARGILDAPFVTFTAAAERFLTSFRIHTLPTMDERDRVMAQALRDVGDTEFHEVEDLPGVRARLLQWLKELKQSGQPLAEIVGQLRKASHAIHPVRATRIQACCDVFEAYQARLLQADMHDHEDLLRTLCTQLESGDIAHIPSLLVVDGFDDFTPVEDRILKALTGRVVDHGGRVVVTLPWDDRRVHVFGNSAQTRSRLLARGFEERTLSSFPRSDNKALRRIAKDLFLQTGPASEQRSEPGRQAVTEIVAASEAREADLIAGCLRALHGKRETFGFRGWRDIGIVVRRVDARAESIADALAKREIPYRIIGRGTSLASSPWVRAANGPLHVLSGTHPSTEGNHRVPFDAHAIHGWLRWCIQVQDDLDDRSAAEFLLNTFELRHRTKRPPSSWAAFCDDAPSVFAPWLASLERHRAACDACEGDPEIFALMAEALGDVVPVPTPGPRSDHGMPLHPWRDEACASAHAARSQVSTLTQSLARAARRTGTAEQLCAADACLQISEGIERTEVRRPDHRLDAVTILGADDARFWELDVVVVAGLESGSFPTAPPEDLFLGDEEREQLRAESPSLHLPTTAGKETRERRVFYGAVTRARTCLVLSRCRFDAKGSPKQPSLYLDALKACAKPTILAEPQPSVGDPMPLRWSFTVSDLALHAARQLAATDAQEQDDAPLSRLLKRVSPATSERLSMAAGEDWSLRPSASPLWEPDPSATQLAPFTKAMELVSASRLNHGAACLHRFWLSYVLNLQPDELSFEAPVLDPRGEGKALHAAAELAVGYPDRSAEEIAKEVVDALMRDDEELAPAEAMLLTDRVTSTIELLRTRTGDGGFSPWDEWLEKRFGFDGDVRVASVALRGQVDRVDTRGDDIIIVDYKRSKSAADGARARAQDMTDLQLPLYALAIEQLTGKRVVGLEWMTLLQRYRTQVGSESAADALGLRSETRGAKVLAEEEFRTFLKERAQHMGHLVDRIRSGDHEKTPKDASVCEACAYARICRFAGRAMAMDDGREGGAP